MKKSIYKYLGSLGYLVIALIFILWAYFLFVSRSTKPSDLNQDKLFELAQDYRLKNGLKSYVKSNSLCEIALLRVHEIEDEFSHRAFQSRLPKMFSETGFKALGENLAMDLNTEDEVMQKWIASPSHKENLDKPFTHSCTKTYLHYAVQIFGYF